MTQDPTQAPPVLAPPARSPEAVRPAVRAGLAALQAVVVGKDAQVRRAFAALLAGGHVLLEDLPGVGKTTLAKGLSRILGGSFQRVQGTNDLLPSDLLGVHLWDAKEQAFRFQPGPVFCQVLLLDELNRIGYANPEVDELLEKGRSTCVEADRKKYYDRLQEVLAEDQPINQKVALAILREVNARPEIARCQECLTCFGSIRRGPLRCSVNPTCARQSWMRRE